MQIDEDNHRQEELKVPMQKAAQMYPNLINMNITNSILEKNINPSSQNSIKHKILYKITSE